MKAATSRIFFLAFQKSKLSYGPGRHSRVGGVRQLSQLTPCANPGILYREETPRTGQQPPAGKLDTQFWRAVTWMDSWVCSPGPELPLLGTSPPGGGPHTFAPPQCLGLSLGAGQSWSPGSAISPGTG